MSTAANLNNPFVGLRPFERDDSLLYFGRAAQVRALLERLTRSRLLAVVGSSGCGKSSLVRAGLIPALEAGFLVEARDAWSIATLKPGAAPLLHLAAALRMLGGATADADADQGLAAELGNLGLEAALAVLGDGAHWSNDNALLIVDQFEELFRFGDRAGGTADARNEAEAFVALLLGLADQTQLPVYCVLTMRADFIGDCDAFGGLPEAMNRGQFLVPRLTRAQRQEAIVGPVHLAGGEIAPRLVDRLLNERLDTRDDLPILQHALMRCWDAWAVAGAAGPIDLCHYEQVHTIHRALDHHAQQALDELTAADPANGLIARRLFQALTELDAGNRRIRRPVRLSDAAALVGLPTSRLLGVIEVFQRTGRNFLVRSGGPHPIIDISHESLIRQWDCLHRWVDEEAAAARLYQRLAETAAAHAAGWADLYQGAALKQARAWVRQEQPNAAWGGRYPGDFGQALAFLRESRHQACSERRARRERRRERKQVLAEQAAQQAAAARRARGWVAGLAVLATLLFVLAATTALSLWEARQQAEAARLAKAAAAEQFRSASTNLALAYQEKALHQLHLADGQQHTRGYQHALLYALQAQRQPIGAGPGLQPVALGQLATAALRRAFEERWVAAAPDDCGPLTALVYSQDGRWLATGCAGPQAGPALRLWDPASGAVLRTLEGHQGPITALAVSPDGARLASSSRDGTLRLWAPESATALAVVGDAVGVNALAFSPDGRLLASGGEDMLVRLRDGASGAVLRTLEGHSGGINGLAFSADGKSLASAAGDGTLRLWDVASGAPLHTWTDHHGWVTAVAFSPRGRLLASGGADHRVVLRDLAGSAPPLVLSGHQGPVTALAFSPDGGRLASGGEGLPSGPQVRLWETGSGDLLAALEGQTAAISGLAFSPDGALIAGAGFDGRLYLWEPQTVAAPLFVANAPGEVGAAAFSPDGKRLAVLVPARSGADAPAALQELPETGLRIFDLANRQALMMPIGHRGAVNAIAFSADGRLLATASADHSVRLWNRATGTLLRELRASRWLALAIGWWNPDTGELRQALVRPQGPQDGHRDAVRAVAFSPDGGRLVSASGGNWDDKSVRLWDVASGRQVALLVDAQGLPAACGDASMVAGQAPRRGQLRALAYSPDGRLIAGAGDDHSVRLWSAADGRAFGVLCGHRDAVTALAFGPDGRWLASAGADGRVLLWAPATGALLHELIGPRGAVHALAVSPDGHWLASAGEDREVRLWSPVTGSQLAVLSGHQDAVRALGFSADGRWFASVAADGSLRLWDRRPWSLLTNGDAPSPRAALISETLQHLWGLCVDGLEIRADDLRTQGPGRCDASAPEIRVDVRAAHEANAPPMPRVFDLRPLLAAPATGQDKLDQFLNWLAAQQRAEPRLAQ